jgi:hypothetical protein
LFICTAGVGSHGGYVRRSIAYRRCPRPWRRQSADGPEAAERWRYRWHIWAHWCKPRCERSREGWSYEAPAGEAPRFRHWNQTKRAPPSPRADCFCSVPVGLGCGSPSPAFKVPRIREEVAVAGGDSRHPAPAGSGSGAPKVPLGEPDKRLRPLLGNPGLAPRCCCPLSAVRSGWRHPAGVFCH